MAPRDMKGKRGPAAVIQSTAEVAQQPRGQFASGDFVGLLNIGGRANTSTGMISRHKGNVRNSDQAMEVGDFPPVGGFPSAGLRDIKEKTGYSSHSPYNRHIASLSVVEFSGPFSVSVPLWN